MARPSDYTPKIIEKSWAYVAQFKDEKTTPKDEVIPSIEGLAVYLDMNRSTLYEWEKEEGKEEFSDIMDALRALQGKTLITGTLTNKLNSNIGKALLSKHGYSEKQTLVTEDEEGKTQPLLVHIIGKDGSNGDTNGV